MLMGNIKQAEKDHYDPYRPLAAPAGAERLAFENPMYGNGNGNRNAVSNPTYADDAGQPEESGLYDEPDMAGDAGYLDTEPDNSDEDGDDDGDDSGDSAE